MLKINLPIVVEGKYDQIKLASFLDAIIIPTDGFQIFKDDKKAALLRRLAEPQGVIVLTDSDSAGAMIRNHLCNLLGADKVHAVLLPPVKGRERRKAKNSAEGLLGVEGMDKQIILDALQRFGVIESAVPHSKSAPVTAAFLYEHGLSGGPESRRLRQALQQALQLPAHMSKNTLLAVLNRITTCDEICSILASLPKPEKE